MDVKSDHKMTLGVLWYPTGYHIAAWRRPEVPANAGFDIKHCVDFAKAVEAAKLDFIFLPDNVGARGDDWNIMSRGAHRYVAQFEPLTLLSALSSVTNHIGLIASATTTYNEPFHIARKIASLDHLSGGRAGWNIVTSINEFEAFNFGCTKHPDHDLRYQRAQEFADLVKRLWNSWEDEAFIMDKASGVFFDPDKVHPTNYQGAHFSFAMLRGMPSEHAAKKQTWIPKQKT